MPQTLNVMDRRTEKETANSIQSKAILKLYYYLKSSLSLGVERDCTFSNLEYTLIIWETLTISTKIDLFENIVIQLVKLKMCGMYCIAWLTQNNNKKTSAFRLLLHYYFVSIKKIKIVYFMQNSFWEIKDFLQWIWLWSLNPDPEKCLIDDFFTSLSNAFKSGHSSYISSCW